VTRRFALPLLPDPPRMSREEFEEAVRALRELAEKGVAEIICLTPGEEPPEDCVVLGDGDGPGGPAGPRVAWDGGGAVIHWNENGAGFVEASDLGLEPGIFPRELTVGGVRLQRSGAVVQAGDVKVVNYFTEDGRYVQVYND
jgi:hypothetical protein